LQSSYNPPYAINSKIIHLISEISETIAVLKYHTDATVLPMLRKKNRIKTLAGTLEIEGNYIGEEKITAILDGKRVLGSKEELLEVNGAMKAYEQLEDYSYNNLNDLLNAHKIMTAQLLNDAGIFRNVNVAVGEHVAPPFFQVPTLMQNLFEWLDESDEHLLIKSCVFHYEFEFIHPFRDCNGRIGRLWQSVILMAHNPLFGILPTESIIKDHQESYYKAIEDSTIQGESTPFIEFMLSSILEAIGKVGNVVGNRVGNITDNQQSIINSMQSNPKVSATMLAEIVGISKRKIEENVAKLKKLGLIERVGGTRGYWAVNI
jgi:Fic family protein